MMNTIERSLLLDQATADTVWCLSCGLHDIARKAACSYGINDTPIRVPACQTCLQQALTDGIDITDSTPVTQPRHVDLINQLLREWLEKEK